MMNSISFTQFPLMPRVYRWESNGNGFSYMNYTNIVQIQDRRVNRNVVTSVSKKKLADSLAEDVPDGEPAIVEKKTRKTTKRAPAKSRKKTLGIVDEDSAVDGNAKDEEISASTEVPKKTQTKTRKKAIPTSKTSEKEEDEEATPKKATKQRKSKKKADVIEANETEFSEPEDNIFAPTFDESDEQDLEFAIEDGEDISYTYGWPPLVCCFGAAQNAFVPAGRRSNRLIDYEIHDRKRDALYEPEKFVRAPGGSSSNVAVALASLGGKVAFMGKLGDDAYGHSLLYYLNINNVQTRAVRIDENKVTAVSRMKIGRRGGLRVASVKPCAEDCLSRSEINVDVLREAQMFYFNTFSLLDRNTRSTALQAVKISKKLGNLVFYDLNLPLPLWQSSEETKKFIQSAWNLSDIIEVTKQELEFLCGIIPSEEFDTRDNNRNKFTHYSPEIVSQLWHENLKILFVTNGTSKIHYYTKEYDGSVYGMEDAPLTPYTSDMSATGDGVVAGIMKMLTVQPHLLLDKGYLERTIKYAINCGVTDQWLQARKLGYPPKEGMEDVDSDPHGIKSITEKQYRTLVPTES
ncbi:hypothetical protein ABFS83_12G090300 [Erythranthe nasuta]